MELQNYSERELVIVIERGKTETIIQAAWKALTYPTEEQLIHISKYCKSKATRELAEIEIIERFPSEKNLLNLAKQGTTKAVALKAWEVTKTFLDENLVELAENSKTEEVKEKALKKLKERFKNISHLIE